MRGSRVAFHLGTFSYHPYIILHFGFDYENETQFYVLVVFYCPSAYLQSYGTQDIIFSETSYWHNIVLVFYSNMGGAPNGEDFNCRR